MSTTGKEDRVWRIVSAAHRPLFVVMLVALSQFTSRRGALLTPSPLLLALGAATSAFGTWLWVSALRHRMRAVWVEAAATTGPYRSIRHPICTSIYLLRVGMCLAFFAWSWFVVPVVFAPLWWLEARREELSMLDASGEASASYRTRAAMLLPGVYWGPIATASRGGPQQRSGS